MEPPISELINQFTKECPGCHKTQIYKSLKTWRKAVKANCPCLDCSNKIRKNNKHAKGLHAIANEERKKRTDEKVRAKKYVSICTSPNCERPVGTNDLNKYEIKIKLGIWLCQTCSFVAPEKGKFKHKGKIKIEEEEWIKNNGSIFKRECPICHEEIIYPSYYKLKARLNAKTPCNKCSTIAFVNSDDGKKQMAEMGKRSGKVYRDGVANGTRERKGLSPEIRERIKQTVTKNGFGPIAGWRCRYKNAPLNSLLELTYVIKVLEANNENWISGEQKEFVIPYLKKCGDLEIMRKYYPDFILVDKKIVIECKPAPFMNDENVIRKRDAALKWCAENGYTYEFADVKRNEYYSTTEFYDMWLNDTIEISEKTKKKLLNMLEKWGKLK